LRVIRRGAAVIHEALLQEVVEGARPLRAAVRHDLGRRAEAGEDLRQRLSRLPSGLAAQREELHPLGEVLNADHDIGISIGLGRRQRTGQVYAPPIEHALNLQGLQLRRSRHARRVGHVAQLAALHNAPDHGEHAPPPVARLQKGKRPLLAQVGEAV
jgi:hypothetical protein